MDQLPLIIWSVSALVLGLMVGSFINVLAARLPFEKSIVWPGSRCFSCYRPVRLFDNIPILGYLRLRGRCRDCGAGFSVRYLWVELGTGLAFLGLFLAEVVFNWFNYPGLVWNYRFDPTPPPPLVGVYVYHAALVALLIAAAVIDTEHRVIPPLIPFTGLVVGVVGAAFLPWPWPHPPAAAAFAQPGIPWMLLPVTGRVPEGVQPWPFYGPAFAVSLAGTWKLGLLNAVLGALAGSFVVRGVKWLFETGFGKEALGLGDADLLMMAGAFLGWQPVVLSLFVGAFAALIVFKLPAIVIAAVRRTGVDRELPFGPGLAVGVVVTWFAWPWLAPKVQPVFFDIQTLLVVVTIVGVGMLTAGLLLRRREEPEPQPQPVGK
ncbi:prepilin peptidase [bacterium]|nr:prepilin peptidase [bacterium]